MSLVYRQPDSSESSLLPPELCLLISDCLEAPATFLVAQHIAQALKAKQRCILFGLSQSFDYYNAILRKQGAQLISEGERGNFAYVDVASLLLSSNDGTTLSNSLLDRLRQHLCEGALIIFDDFSGLVHSGLPPLKALRLFRKLQYLIRRSKGCLVTVYHDDAFAPGKAQISRLPDDSFLLRNMQQTCDVWIQTRSLRAQMTGEIIVHRGPALMNQNTLATHCVEQPLQYKLEESGANYFAKGTSKGFL